MVYHILFKNMNFSLKFLKRNLIIRRSILSVDIVPKSKINLAAMFGSGNEISFDSFGRSAVCWLLFNLLFSNYIQTGCGVLHTNTRTQPSSVEPSTFGHSRTLSNLIND